MMRPVIGGLSICAADWDSVIQVNMPVRLDASPSAPAVFCIAIMTVALTAVVLTAFWVGLQEHGKDLAETMAFATLALAELPIAYTTRSERYPLIRLGLFTNKWMQAAVALSALLTVAVIFVPFLNGPFNTVPLTVAQWELVLPLALIPAAVAEASKFVLRSLDRRRQQQASA